MIPDGDTLDPLLRELVRRNGLDTVAGAFAFRGGETLSKPGLVRRRRTRLILRDEENRTWEMYLKRYDALPTLSRLARFLRGRRRSCPAVREFNTIRQIRTGGVPTMREIACGAEQGLLDVGRSYLLVAAVPGDALERIGGEFVSRNANDPQPLEELTDKLISLIRGLHEMGYVHRDLYASHIFLHEHEGQIELYLIDLARAFRPRWRNFRWRVKDLAQLKYSMPWLWVERYWDRFLSGYLQSERLHDPARWQRAIDRKVRKIQRHDLARRRRRKDPT